MKKTLLLFVGAALLAAPALALDLTPLHLGIWGP